MSQPEAIILFAKSGIHPNLQISTYTEFANLILFHNPAVEQILEMSISTLS